MNKDKTYIPTDKDFRRLLDNVSRFNYRGAPTTAVSQTPYYLAIVLVLLGATVFISHEWALSVLKDFTSFQ